MKKHLFLLLVFVITFIGCGNNSTNQKNQETVTTNTEVIGNSKLQEDNTNSTIPLDFEQFVSLYNELLGFKDKANFKQYGFGQGGPYYSWLERANKFEKTANVSHFSQYGFVPADLAALGNIYVSSKGVDNDAAKILRSAIDKGIAKAYGLEQETNQVQEQKESTSSTNTTTNETVIGHWKLSGALKMDIKIVQRGKQYISIENGKQIKLTRKGDKYYLDNSKTGEYYKISNGNLRLCDKDGDFTDSFNIKIEKLN